MMPKVIRSLFAVMISSCEISSPLELWTTFKESMSEDYLHTARLSDPGIVFNERIENQALIAIEDKVLNATNRTLDQFGLPSTDRSELATTTNRMMI